MIADDRLHDRKAQAGPVLLGGVVGREKPLALLRRQTTAGVGNLQIHAAILFGRPQHQHTASGHGVHGIEHQVFNCAVQQCCIGLNHGQIVRQVKFG